QNRSVAISTMRVYRVKTRRTAAVRATNGSDSRGFPATSVNSSLTRLKSTARIGMVDVGVRGSSSARWVKRAQPSVTARTHLYEGRATPREHGWTVRYEDRRWTNSVAKT